ncbi:MAG: hypothetical protein AB7O73_07250 [Bacteroidia bacterium]
MAQNKLYEFSYPVLNSTKQKSALLKFTNKQELKKTVFETITEFQNQGYLLAYADTIENSSEKIKIELFSGTQFKWLRLKQGNLNPTLASKIRFNEKAYSNQQVNILKIGSLFESILVYYENHGYPFVSLKLDSLNYTDSTFDAQLNVVPGTFYKLDSVILYGNANVKSKYLERYLNVFTDKPFQENQIAKISDRLRQLPFVTQKKSPEVRFTKNSSKLLLFLDKKNASQFDGIVGILPDATTGKAIITGDVKLKIINGLLHNGETIDIEWRRLQSQTQDFSGKIIYPFLFGSPFGADYAIKLYKRDTTFIDIINSAGAHYYFNGLNYIKVLTRSRQCNLISTYGLENITVLPSYADVSTLQNGIGLHLENLDYRFNPRKGFNLEMNALFGNKRIRKNPKINDLVYASLPLNSIQYQYEFEFNGFIPIKNNNILRLGLKSASIFGNGPIFRNELNRIGGLKTLRGFDEESIFTSLYFIPTLEYRFLFSQNSHILVFTEGAFYENNSYQFYLNDTPLSFGAGINFETKAGILSINYAIGNQLNNGFDARNGKIHIGLIALF